MLMKDLAVTLKNLMSMGCDRPVTGIDLLVTENWVGSQLKPVSERAIRTRILSL
jgi:hypothetical protein